MARYTLQCPAGPCGEIIEIRRDVNLGGSEPPGAYLDCALLACERMAAHLHDSHGARSPQERRAEQAAGLAASVPAGMLLLSEAITAGSLPAMHDHPIAGRQSAAHRVSTHHGHSGGHLPHAHPDGDWREQWCPGSGTSHMHAYRGQVLAHDHDGGDVPHGYYGHPEDPAATTEQEN